MGQNQSSSLNALGLARSLAEQTVLRPGPAAQTGGTWGQRWLRRARGPGVPRPWRRSGTYCRGGWCPDLGGGESAPDEQSDEEAACAPPPLL